MYAAADDLAEALGEELGEEGEMLGEELGEEGEMLGEELGEEGEMLGEALGEELGEALGSGGRGGGGGGGQTPFHGLAGAFESPVTASNRYNLPYPKVVPFGPSVDKVGDGDGGGAGADAGARLLADADAGARLLADANAAATSRGHLQHLDVHEALLRETWPPPTSSAEAGHDDGLATDEKLETFSTSKAQRLIHGRGF